MTYIDFHTHHASLCGEVVVQQGVQSWGIHPCEADTACWNPQLEGCIAIGECGLDHLCSVPLRMQEELFLRHIQLSEVCRMPLIIHCVRAHEEILRLHRDQHPSIPWIIHGFRGKPAVMHRLLQQGFYLSFGPLFNKDSLQECPPERLLVETDNHPLPVKDVYEAVAAAKGMHMPVLITCMQRNYADLYGNDANWRALR